MRTLLFIGHSSLDPDFGAFCVPERITIVFWNPIGGSSMSCDADLDGLATAVSPLDYLRERATRGGLDVYGPGSLCVDQPLFMSDPTYREHDLVDRPGHTASWSHESGGGRIVGYFKNGVFELPIPTRDLFWDRERRRFRLDFFPSMDRFQHTPSGDRLALASRRPDVIRTFMSRGSIPVTRTDRGIIDLSDLANKLVRRFRDEPIVLVVSGCRANVHPLTPEGARLLDMIRTTRPDCPPTQTAKRLTHADLVRRFTSGSKTRM